jgi:hypothetical protein
MTKQELEAINKAITERLAAINHEVDLLRLERDTITEQRLQNMNRINELLQEELGMRPEGE